MPGKRRPDLPDPDDVLAGRCAVRLEQLFELVHAVNPSERGLEGRELAAAYATKARLQSLLIERFGEQLVVQEVPESGSDVIGIVHRTYRKDACHAVVAQLSAKAKAWVRWQRDVRTESEGERAAPATPRPAPDPGGAVEVKWQGKAVRKQVVVSARVLLREFA
jgi:hypothetical protein